MFLNFGANLVKPNTSYTWGYLVSIKGLPSKLELVGDDIQITGQEQVKKIVESVLQFLEEIQGCLAIINRLLATIGQATDTSQLEFQNYMDYSLQAAEKTVERATLTQRKQWQTTLVLHTICL